MFACWPPRRPKLICCAVSVVLVYEVVRVRLSRWVSYPPTPKDIERHCVGSVGTLGLQSRHPRQAVFLGVEMRPSFQVAPEGAEVLTEGWANLPGHPGLGAAGGCWWCGQRVGMLGAVSAGPHCPSLCPSHRGGPPGPCGQRFPPSAPLGLSLIHI